MFSQDFFHIQEDLYGSEISVTEPIADACSEDGKVEIRRDIVIRLKSRSNKSMNLVLYSVVPIVFEVKIILECVRQKTKESV